MQDVDNLMAVYNDVDDMDMYIAGLVELPISNGALIGPTALCLIADQFAKTKNGDRFFYDVGNQISSFTLGMYSTVQLQIDYTALVSNRNFINSQNN